MVKLREYQNECLNTIHSHFKKHDRQLIQLPTGAGKTYIFLSYLKKYSNKSLIIVPTVELLEQVQNSALEFFPASKVFAKTKSAFRVADHTIITAASLNHKFTRDYLFQHDFDTIVIDEAHRSYCSTYIKFLSDYHDPNCKFKLLGMTATPERLDEKPLLDIFGELTFNMNLVDLINNNELCNIRSFRIETKQNLSSTTNNGDFRPIELNKLDNESRNAIIIKTVKEQLSHKSTIIFCVSINHAEGLAEKLRENGLNAEAIHGKMSRSEREGIISQFKRKKIDILTNCQLLTEGFDAPCIENIVIARHTSNGVYIFKREI